MSTAKTPYRPSPTGDARYPWINKPDTKFNAAGLFKTDLIVSGEPAATFRAKLDTDAQAAFEAETKDMTPGERKKFSLYVPYTVEEDDEGNPTGRIIFHFKQNATLTIEGAEKQIRIAIFNAADEPKEIPIWSGDKIRVMYRPRTIKLASTKQVGIRLDFLKVQVLAKASRDAAPGGFGSVEGGYMGEEEGGFDTAASGAASDTSGDY